MIMKMECDRDDLRQSKGRYSLCSFPASAGGMKNQGDVKSAQKVVCYLAFKRSYNSQIKQIWYQDFAGARNSRLSTPGTCKALQFRDAETTALHSFEWPQLQKSDTLVFAGPKHLLSVARRWFLQWQTTNPSPHLSTIALSFQRQ